MNSTVAGALNVLQSSMKPGNNVKRVVFTSSAAAMTSELPEPRPLNESDWNEASLKVLEEKGRQASIPDKFSACKVVTERAMWAFMDAHKDTVKFDLVVLHPVWTIGPPLDISGLDTVDQVVHSVKMWWNILMGKDKKILAHFG